MLFESSSSGAQPTIALLFVDFSINAAMEDLGEPIFERTPMLLVLLAEESWFLICFKKLIF